MLVVCRLTTPLTGVIADGFTPDVFLKSIHQVRKSTLNDYSCRFSF